MIKEAIILAGGFGTRLREAVADVPKPMAPVSGAPFLDYVLYYLSHFGVEHVVLSVGYQAEIIQTHYGDQFKDIKLSYAFEKDPLGTGGAIQFAMQQTDAEEVLVLNGDTFFDVDLNALYDAHENLKGDVTMVLREVAHPDRYGTVDLGEFARVTQFHEKREGLENGMINGGVYLMDRGVFDLLDLPEKFSIEQDFFSAHVDLLKIYGFPSTGYFIDIGIPEDYYKANEAFRLFKY